MEFSSCSSKTVPIFAGKNPNGNAENEVAMT
jgi:hypothetical protein